MKTAEGTPAARQTQRVIVTKRVHGSSALDPTLTTDAQDPTALQSVSHPNFSPSIYPTTLVALRLAGGTGYYGGSRALGVPPRSTG